MKRILFVCTGNTCRSLMAEGLGRSLLDDQLLAKEFSVASAGLVVSPGAPGSESALEVLAAEGINLSQHRAVQLSPEMVDQADLILTMTAGQKRHLLELYAQGMGKTFLLKEYASEADRLGDQLTACLIDLRARQQDFQLEHGRRLQSLERERRGLLERLQVIEDELAEQQDVLEQEVRPVIEQVRRAEFDLSRYDIPDPYGQSREVYQECADELKAALAALHQRLLEQR